MARRQGMRHNILLTPSCQGYTVIEVDNLSTWIHLANSQRSRIYCNISRKSLLCHSNEATYPTEELSGRLTGRMWSLWCCTICGAVDVVGLYFFLLYERLGSCLLSFVSSIPVWRLTQNILLSMLLNPLCSVFLEELTVVPLYWGYLPDRWTKRSFDW